MTMANRSMTVSQLSRADKSRGVRGTAAGSRYINLSRGKEFFHRDLGKNASPYVASSRHDDRFFERVSCLFPEKCEERRSRRFDNVSKITILY